MGKMRSPNFPIVPLGQAIDLAEKIFREDRQNAIEKEVAAKHMGYTGLTGRTLKLLGALSQYGLIEKVAKGQIRVSKNAVSILHWNDESERREAIGKAGTSPVLFRRIRDNFDDPSERTITSYLIKEGFTDSAIPTVLRSYRETNRFLAETGVPESYGSGAVADADSLSDFEDEPELEHPTRAAPRALVDAPSIDQCELRLIFDLHSVSVSGTTKSPAKLREFVGKLTALQELFEQFAAKEAKADGAE